MNTAIVCPAPVSSPDSDRQLRPTAVAAQIVARFRWPPEAANHPLSSAIFSSDTVSYVWFPQLSTPVTGIAAVRQFTSNISHFKVFKMLIRVHEESFVLFFFNSFILLDKKPFLIAMFCLLGTILAFMMMGNKLIKGNELPGVIQ